MKKFYKNKKILIAMTSLIFCFTLNSKTMAMTHEKNDNFIGTINDFADETKQNDTTDINTKKKTRQNSLNKKNKLIKSNDNTNIANTDKQAKTTTINNENDNEFANTTEQANITDLDEKTKDLIKQINDFADETKQNDTTDINTKKKTRQNFLNKKNKLIKSNDNTNIADTTEQANITDLDEKTKDLIKQINDFADETKQNATTNLTNKKRKGNKNRSKRLNLINKKLENLTLIYLIEDLFSNDLIMSTETIPISPDIRSKLKEIHESVYLHEPFDNDRCDEYEHFFTNCIESLNKILNKDVQISHDYFDIFLKPLCIFKEKTKHEDEVINDIYALNKIINILEPSYETKPIFEKTLNKMLKNSSKKIILKNNVKPSFDNLNIKIKYDNLDNNNEIVEDNNNLINLNKKTYTDEELNLPKAGEKITLNDITLTFDQEMADELKNIIDYTRKHEPFINKKDKKFKFFKNYILENKLKNIFKSKTNDISKISNIIFHKYIEPTCVFKKLSNEELNFPYTDENHITLKIKSNDNEKILFEKTIKIPKYSMKKLRQIHKFIYYHKPFASEKYQSYRVFKQKIINKLEQIFNFKIAEYYFDYYLKPLFKFNKEFCDKVFKDKNQENEYTDEELNLPFSNEAVVYEYDDGTIPKKHVIAINDSTRKLLRKIHYYVFKQNQPDKIYKRDTDKYNKTYSNANYRLSKIFKDEKDLCPLYFKKYLKPLCHYKPIIAYKDLNLPQVGNITLEFLKNKEIKKINKYISEDDINMLEEIHKTIYYDDETFPNNKHSSFLHYRKKIAKNSLQPIFKDEEKIAFAYFDKYLESLCNFKDQNNKIIDIDENIDEDIDESLGEKYSDEELHLPKSKEITLTIKPNEEDGINYKKQVTIPLDRARIKALRKVHNITIKQAPKEQSLIRFKNRIIYWILQAFEQDPKISRAYLNEIVVPLFIEIQKKQNNKDIKNIDKNFDLEKRENENITSISKNFDEDQNNNINKITDISENFDEEHFNKLLNLPKLGTITLLVKPYGSPSYLNSTLQNIVIDENNIGQLEKIHIRALIESLLIGIFESDNTGKCPEYLTFRTHICGCLIKIFKQSNIAIAYFNKIIKPLLNFKEQQNKKNKKIIKQKNN